MKISIKKTFLIILLFLFACSPQKRLANLIKNHPELFNKDTIYKEKKIFEIDTVVLLEQKFDTVIQDNFIKIFEGVKMENDKIQVKVKYDTIYKNFQFQTKIKQDTLFLRDTIKVKETVIVNQINIKEYFESKIKQYYWYFLLFIIAALIFRILIKKYIL